MLPDASGWCRGERKREGLYLVGRLLVATLPELLRKPVTGLGEFLEREPVEVGGLACAMPRS